MPINENNLLKQELIDFIKDEYPVTESEIQYPNNTVPNNLASDTQTILTTATNNGAEIPQALVNYLNSTDEQIQTYALKIISDAVDAQKDTAQAQVAAAERQADALQTIANNTTALDQKMSVIQQHQKTLADKTTVISDKISLIEQHQNVIADETVTLDEKTGDIRDQATRIEQHQKQLADTVVSQAQATEATLEANLRGSDSERSQDIWNEREKILRSKCK